MMKRMNLQGSKSYKRIYFSVILLLLTVMLLFSLFFYARFIKRQKKDIYQRAQDSIERIENWMNTQFQEMSRIVLEINNDGIFSYAPISSKSQREELIAELLRYVRGYSFAMDMSYESMLDENTIYSSQGIFERENFEKYIYDIAEDFDEEVYLMRRKHQIFTTISSNQLIVRMYPRKAVAYVFGLPLMSEAPKRLITFYVNKNTIDDIVRQFLPCDMLDVRFYEQDTLVYSLYDTESIPDKSSVISCEGSLGQYRYELIADPIVLYVLYTLIPNNVTKYYEQLNEQLAADIHCSCRFVSDMRAAIEENAEKILKFEIFPLPDEPRRMLLDMLERCPDMSEEGNLRTSVELHASGVNKGTGLAEAARYFGIPMENVMAIGDGENDVTMLKMAGMGAAMGNAVSEAKAAADIVLPSNNEDGVAWAIHQFVHKKEG